MAAKMNPRKRSVPAAHGGPDVVYGSDQHAPQNVVETSFAFMTGLPVTANPLAPSHADAKAFGAFYTDAQIAEFLAWWAIRERGDTVLDPSFGGGVFLR